MPSTRVLVPATSANLGPGFDCLGLAVGVYNEMEFTWGGRVKEIRIEIQGEGADRLPLDDTHLTLQALRRGLKSLDLEMPPIHLKQNNGIPLSRGMGSSASAIVAGLLAARVIAKLEPDPDWVLQHANALEGHPDNVSAAIYGGFVTAYMPSDTESRCLSLPFPDNLQIALAVPEFRITTEAARRSLPRRFRLGEVVFTLSRATLLIGALATGSLDLIKEASRDRIHTPYRAPLITGMTEVEAAAYDNGAVGFFISGSGPTVGAFVPGTSPESARPVAQAMALAFNDEGIEAKGLWLGLERNGARIVAALEVAPKS